MVRPLSSVGETSLPGSTSNPNGETREPKTFDVIETHSRCDSTSRHIGSDPDLLQIHFRVWTEKGMMYVYSVAPD